MKTFIAIPCMDTLPVEFVQSFVNLRKTNETYYAFKPNSLIYDSRNTIAANVIQKDYDRVLWLDSDMVFSADLLERLSADMDTGLDYVAGLFFKRKLPTSPCVYKELKYETDDNGIIHAHAEPYRDYPADTLFDVAGTGFGAVMTSVKMLRDVWDHYGPPFHPLLQMGEDLSFCWRAAQTGYKMYCDSRIHVGHCGHFVYDEGAFLMGKAEPD